MVRRIQVPWCVRSAVAFSVGFSLGALLHLGINMTFNSTQHEGRWSSGSLLPDTPEAARSTASPPRILCYVLTGPKTHQASLHVKNTWGQRCDRTLFFSTQEDPNLGTIALDVPEGYNYLWAKAKGALGHLHTNYPGYDWYMKADDDTFVIVENLRYFLKDIDPGNPVYYGVKFKHHVKQGYMSGGGGYVLSSEALRRFVIDALTLTDQTRCSTNDTRGAEDLLLGECLESIGVSAGDSLDEKGRSRFFSHSPLSLFYKQPLINRFHWYWRYLWHKHGVGPDCCSQHLVSFHDIDPRMMWTLETLLYRIHIHHDLQPPHLNTSTSTVPPPTSPVLFSSTSS